MATSRGPTLHHLNDSQSQRILWLMEELRIAYNLQYELKLWKRQESGPDKQRAPPELKEIHPLGKSPLLVTEDGRVIGESTTIALYLIKTYDPDNKFKGSGSSNDEIRDDMLSSLSNSTAMIPGLVSMFFALLTKMSPFFVRPIFSGAYSMLQKRYTTPELTAVFEYMETEIGSQDYFMGATPGRADFMLSWPVDFCTAMKYIDLNKFPKVKAWHGRCHAREAWKESLKKGNGYQLDPTAKV